MRGRKEQIKLQGVVSGWQILQKDVPQGSIMGSLLFNIFYKKIFFTLLNMVHCTTMLMTTPYHMHDQDYYILINVLENESLYFNFMV